MITNNKLFNVVTATNLTNNGETIQNAIVIEFKDQNAKDKVISAFCDIFKFVPSDVQPSSDAFFNRFLMDTINNYLRSHAVQTAVSGVADAASAQISVELP